jgi:hypothetical protein
MEPVTVAYHLETHRNPAQVERLIRRLREQSPSSPIVVNHDVRAEPLDRAGLERRWDVVVIDGEGGYSDLSHARRWLQTVAWLDEHGVAYDWLSNLSGQCYPVRSLAAVHAELGETDADAFIETFDTGDPLVSTWGLRLADTRYRFAHRRVTALSTTQMKVLRPVQAVNRVQPWVRVTTATGLTVGRRVSQTPFDDELVLRGGSFFTTLRRPAVEHVVRFTVERADVMSHLATCLAPSEVVFQTALGASDSLRVVNDCRRYFDFSRTRYNRPRTLDLTDLPKVLASGKDFARKLDLDRDPELFDLFDQVADGRSVAEVTAQAEHRRLDDHASST